MSRRKHDHIELGDDDIIYLPSPKRRLESPVKNFKFAQLVERIDKVLERQNSKSASNQVLEIKKQQENGESKVQDPSLPSYGQLKEQAGLSQEHHHDTLFVEQNGHSEHIDKLESNCDNDEATILSLLRELISTINSEHHQPIKEMTNELVLPRSTMMTES